MNLRANLISSATQVHACPGQTEFNLLLLTSPFSQGFRIKLFQTFPINISFHKVLYFQRTKTKEQMNRKLPVVSEKYIPSFQVKANENQELNGIFPFSIVNLHFF